MSKIISTIDKIVIEGGKSGEKEYLFTCSTKMQVSIVSYTNNLKGNVEITTEGNGTTIINLKIKYSDLYLYGETYSGVANITSATDVVSIPIVINCADNLITTNIPDNVIVNTNESVNVIFTSIPEVNKVILKQNTSNKDISHLLNVHDGFSDITLSPTHLRASDYVLASSSLNQVSIEIGDEGSDAPTDVYVFERDSSSPIYSSYKGGIISLKFISTLNGKGYYNKSYFDIKLDDGLAIDSWDNNGIFKLRVNSNSTNKELKFNVSITHKINGQTINWTIVQGAPKDNPSSYIFTRLSDTVINIESAETTFSIKLKSVKNGFELPITDSNISYKGLALQSIVSDGVGVFDITFTAPQHNSGYEYNIIVTQPETGNILEWNVIQNKVDVTDRYVFEQITPSPIHVNWISNTINIELISTHDGEPHHFEIEAPGLEIKRIGSNSSGSFMITIQAPSEAGGDTYNVSAIQSGSGLKLDWVIYKSGMDVDVNIDDIWKDDYEYDENAPKTEYWLCKYYIPDEYVGVPVRIFTSAKAPSINYTDNGVTILSNQLNTGESFQYENLYDSEGGKIEMEGIEIVHVFDYAGIHTMRIPYHVSDTRPGWGVDDWTFRTFTDCSNLISCASANPEYETWKYSDWNGTFYNCVNLKYFATDKLSPLRYKYSWLGQLSYTFYNCHKLNSLWKTIDELGGGFGMDHTFYNCYNLLDADANFFTSNEGAAYIVVDVGYGGGYDGYMYNPIGESVFENCVNLEKIKVVTSLSSRCFAGCSKLKEVVFVGDYKYIQSDSLPENGLHGVCYFEKFDINNKNNCIDNGWNYVFDMDRIIPYDDVDNGCELHIITNPLSQGTYTILKSIDAYDGAYRGEMTMAMKEINCNFQASFVSHSGLEVVVPQVFDENGYPVNSPIELTIKFHTKYVHPVYRWFYDQSDKRKKVLFPSLDINENNIQYNSIVFSDETKFICTKELFNNLDIANINFNTSQQYLLNANHMFSGVEGKFPIIDTINNCDCDYMYAYTNLENVTGLKYTNCSVLGMFSGCHLLNKLDIDITGSIEYYGSGYWVEMTFIENCVVLNELSQLDVQRFRVKSFDLRSNVALEHFGGLKGATENIDISTCVLLTRDSLVNIINSLGTPGSVRYLYLNEAHFAKLTDEDLAIASRKGWVVTA